MLLQLDPLDHHFDPEGQVPTLWTSSSWSTGSEGCLDYCKNCYRKLP
jgi:hypothetical protein